MFTASLTVFRVAGDPRSDRYAGIDNIESAAGIAEQA